MPDEPDDGKAGNVRPQKTTGSKQSSHRRRRQPRLNQTDLDWTYELLSKPVKIDMKGRARTISTFEAILAAISLKAVAGDHRALVLQLKYKTFAAQTARKNSKVEVVFADSDYTRALATDEKDSNVD